MHRFYADGLGEIGSLVTLSEEDARHASRVLRMQPGDAAELFLDGRRFSAEIAEMTAEGVTARLISELPSTEAKLRITLYQGLPKAEKMELIVQKAVELGAARNFSSIACVSYWLTLHPRVWKAAVFMVSLQFTV